LRKGSKDLGIFKDRLPARQDVITVLSVVVFVVFSWSIRGFLFIFPSRVMYLGAWDILSVFMYMMAFALVESLLILAVLVAVSAVLPKKWLRQGFPYKGLLVTIVGAAAAVWYQGNLGNTLPPGGTLLSWGAVLAILLLSLIIISHSFSRLGQVLTALAERFTIFNYVYLPLGFLGVLVVLLRNILPF